jgi:hypothetical protein
MVFLSSGGRTVYRFGGNESRLASAVSPRSGLTDEDSNDAPASGRFSR